MFPSIRCNILSGFVLVREDFQLDCKCNKVVISHLSSDCFYGKDYLYDVENLFKHRIEYNNTRNVNVSSSHSVAFSIKSSDMWHGRLGHANFDSLKRMMNLNIIPKFAIDKKNKYEIHMQAKQLRKPFHVVDRKYDILDLVHTDICEFNGMFIKDNKKHFITFIDDCSRFCYVYLLKSKDEVLEKFLIFKNEVETQIGKILKRLRSDRGREYTSNLFQQHCQDANIVHEVIALYSPQSNGVAKHKNRTLMDMVNVYCKVQNCLQTCRGKL